MLYIPAYDSPRIALHFSYESNTGYMIQMTSESQSFSRNVDEHKE